MKIKLQFVNKRYEALPIMKQNNQFFTNAAKIIKVVTLYERKLMKHLIRNKIDRHICKIIDTT